MFGWVSRVALVVTVSAFLALTVGLAPHAAHAQDVAPRAPPDTALRLEALLRAQRDRGESVRVIGGVVELGIGLGAAGLGTYAFVAGTVDAARALGIGVLTVGVLLAAFGGVILAVDTTPEDRWQRWVAVRARGVSPYDVAEFVGELRAEARRAQLDRSITVASGVALTLAGAAATALGVTLGDEGLRTGLEITGIGLGLAGIVLSLLALAIEPDNVRELRAYERGTSPGPAPARPAVTPLVAPGTAGVAIGGSF